MHMHRETGLCLPETWEIGVTRYPRGKEFNLHDYQSYPGQGTDVRSSHNYLGQTTRTLPIPPYPYQSLVANINVFHIILLYLLSRPIPCSTFNSSLLKFFDKYSRGHDIISIKLLRILDSALQFLIKQKFIFKV